MVVVLATFRERTEAKAATIGALYGQDWLAVPEQSLECALAELAEPDAVFVPDSELGRERLGIAEAMCLFDRARDDWVSCRYLADRIDEHGDRVLVSGKVVAEARESGARACFSFAHLWRSEGGRVVEVVAYHGLDEALAALAEPNSP
jgi:ketosteroid isomerase-like protein